MTTVAKFRFNVFSYVARYFLHVNIVWGICLPWIFSNCFVWGKTWKHTVIVC